MLGSIFAAGIFAIGGLAAIGVLGLMLITGLLWVIIKIGDFIEGRKKWKRNTK